MAKLNKSVKGRKPGRPKTGRTPAFVVYARIDQSLGEQFAEYVNGVRPKTTQAAVIELLIEQFLAKVAAENRPVELP